MPRVTVDLSDDELMAAQLLIPAFAGAVIEGPGIALTAVAPASAEDWMDTSTATAVLGTSRDTLLRWVENDETLGRKIEGRWWLNVRRIRSMPAYRRFRSRNR